LAREKRCTLIEFLKFLAVLVLAVQAFAETVELIKQMALDNGLWGAERIRGELLKLDIHVCKRTIQN
jgi:hypothetical protein